MQEECRLVGRDEDVAAGIAAWTSTSISLHCQSQSVRIHTDTKVSAAVQASERRAVLQRVLERQDVRRRRELLEQVGRLEPVGGEVVVDITAMAAGVVAVAVGAGVGFDAEFGVHGGGQRAEVDCQACKC
jgi:hypothetical protein